MLHNTRLKPVAFRRGIALVDVIIGAVILAVGLAVVISLTTRSLRTQTDGEKRLTASWLADELVTMVLVEGPVNYPKLYDNNGNFDYPFEDFSYDLYIEDEGPHQPYRVTANISWEGGGDRRIQVQTYISERGGDPNQPRIPLDPVDRDARWNEIEQAATNGGAAAGGSGAGQSGGSGGSGGAAGSGASGSGGASGTGASGGSSKGGSSR